MRKIFLSVLLSSFMIVGFLNAQSQNTVALHPFQDASIGVNQGFGSGHNNYGTADHYSTFCQRSASGVGQNAAMGIMQFDLSQIPQGSIIVSASLDLYGRGPYGVGDAVSKGDCGQNQSDLCRIINPWDQSTVTFATRPNFTAEDEVELPKSNGSAEDYLGINVTQLVQDMIDNPETSFGFLLKLINDHVTRSLAFCSTNYPDSTKWQTLTITYTTPNALVQQNTNADNAWGQKNLVNAVVSPNPFTSETTLKITDNSSNITDKQITIYNLSGQVVQRIETTDNVIAIQHRDMLSGPHYFTISEGNKIVFTGKLIAE